MFGQLTDLFPVIFISAFVALISTEPLIRLASRLRLVDLPGSAPHKVHLTPTPLAGGLIIFVSLAAAYITLHPTVDKNVLSILLGSVLMGLWGGLDDRLDLPPFLKLGGQLILAGLLVVIGVKVQITRIPLVDLMLTLLWIVGIINAFNFVDSMDGLALGIGGISAAFFMFVTIDSLQPTLAILSAAIIGSTVGMYLFGTAPARMFLGDSGALMLGFLLAGIGIAYTPAQAGLPQALTWFIPILVLGVPIFDMTLVVFSRLRRRLPVYRAGQDHTYHRLVSLGLHPNRVVVLMQVLSILLGLLAFIALKLSVLGANLLFVVMLLLGLAAILYLEKSYSRG